MNYKVNAKQMNWVDHFEPQSLIVIEWKKEIYITLGKLLKFVSCHRNVHLDQDQCKNGTNEKHRIVAFKEGEPSMISKFIIVLGLARYDSNVQLDQDRC